VEEWIRGQNPHEYWAKGWYMVSKTWVEGRQEFAQQDSSVELRVGFSEGLTAGGGECVDDVRGCMNSGDVMGEVFDRLRRGRGNEGRDDFARG
jgi:hypothetical protein